MKIYTKTGDKGKTSLFGGKRVAKDNARIEAYGTVDELMSWVGLLRDQEVAANEQLQLTAIQSELFTIGSHLAADPDKAASLKLPELNAGQIESLEELMDEMNASLPEMRHFVLPGGHPAVSYCHIARTVCRRAERRVVAINEDGRFTDALKYLNRLSDYFFVLARWWAKKTGADEIPWMP